MRRLADACAAGDLGAVEPLLAADVVAVCDGGGLVPAAADPVCGSGDVALLLIGVLGRPGTDLSVESVNGLPGLVLRRTDGTAVAVVAARCGAAPLSTLWIVLNPAKLNGWHRR
ncbi:siderophore-interacting protein [Actinoplanes sp. OR16]|uniref:siderophore-interacting protein n=1 Tax=Actinoplanes sp. OR16 TaxID=946334 RepID=UPI001E38D987|nr:siderophore-interacting protein [Actinoplanes sp. OR16]